MSSCLKQELERELIEKCLETLQQGYSDRWVVRREDECDALQRLLEQSLERESRLVYVSGPPGTGKTSTVRQLLAALAAKPRFRRRLRNCCVDELLINGATVSSAKVFLGALSKALRLPAPSAAAVSQSFARQGFDAAFESALLLARTDDDKVIWLVIDEVDRLGKVRGLSNLLCRLWAGIEDVPNVCLLTLSNALTAGAALQRCVSAEAGRIQCLSFGALTETQMEAILQRRVETARQDLAESLLERKEWLKTNGADLPGGHSRAALLRYLAQFEPIEPSARKLMCKRLAAALGDCRLLLSVAREHLALQVERVAPNTPETRASPKSSGSPPLAQQQQLLGGGCETLAAVRALPLEQQLLLIAICKSAYTAGSAAVAIAEVKKSLNEICDDYGVPSAFVTSPVLISGGISGLAAAGFIVEKRGAAAGGSGRKKKGPSVELGLIREEIDVVLANLRNGAFRRLLD